MGAWRAVLPLVLAFPAAAEDLVVLTNGGRLFGEVQGLSQGKLRLKTDHSEVLEIRWDRIAELETAGLVRVELKGGAFRTGRLSMKEGRLRIRERDVDPPAEVAAGEVVAFNPGGTRLNGNVTLSVSAEDGNTDSQDLFAAFEMVLESGDHKALARGHATFGREDREVTDRAAYGLLKYDFRFAEDDYLYASGEIRSDKFEDLQYRSVLGVGAGHIFLRESWLDFWLEAGPAFISEETRDGSSDTWFGGRLAVHLWAKLPLGLELRDDFSIYPNFEETADWQLHNEASLSTPIGSHWSLRASVITDVDHRPLPGKSSDDNSYVVGLQYKF